MHKKVRNEEELNLFNSIWTRSWEEKGFELEFGEEGDRYIIRNRRANPYVATAEFKPYKGADSAIDEVFPFYSFANIRDNLDRVYEVDKVAILKEFRDLTTLNAVLMLTAFYALRSNAKYYVALIDPKLYKALRNVFKFPIEQIGNKIFYKGDYAIPVCIDMEYYLEHNSISTIRRSRMLHKNRV